MSRSEIIQQMIRELKLYKKYLLNMKTLNTFKKEVSDKRLIKK